jgi:hypothetical protein
LAGVLDAADKNYPESAGLLGLRVRVLTDQRQPYGGSAVAACTARAVAIGAFDFWLRLSWHPKVIYQFPLSASASLTGRMLYREYGLFWPPVLICPPLWLTIVILLVYLAWFAVAP